MTIWAITRDLTSTLTSKPKSTPTPTPAKYAEPDEDDVREFIQDYSEAKRLAPGRANDLLEAALGGAQPSPPDADACCGSSCCPCVNDLWREEVAVWKAVREGTPVDVLAAKKNFKS